MLRVSLVLAKMQAVFYRNDCISASNFESTGNTWSTSYVFLSDLHVPLGHSWIPYATTLYLRSGNCTLVEAAFSCPLIDSDSDEFWWLGGLVGDSIVDEDFSRLSSEVSFLTASFNFCISAACDFRWQCGQWKGIELLINRLKACFVRPVHCLCSHALHIPSKNIASWQLLSVSDILSRQIGHVFFVIS